MSDLFSMDLLPAHGNADADSATVGSCDKCWDDSDGDAATYLALVEERDRTGQPCSMDDEQHHFCRVAGAPLCGPACPITFPGPVHDYSASPALQEADRSRETEVPRG